MTTETMFWFDARTAKLKKLYAELKRLQIMLTHNPKQLKQDYIRFRYINLEAYCGYEQALAIPNMPYTFTRYVRTKRSALWNEFQRNKQTVRTSIQLLQNTPATLRRVEYEINCLEEEPELDPQPVNTTGLNVIIEDGLLHIERPATVAKLSSTHNTPHYVQFEGEPCVRISPYFIVLAPASEVPSIRIQLDATSAEKGFCTSFNRNAPNPHCLGNGVPCFGDFIAPIQDALEQHDLHLLVDVVDAFMRQINVDDSAGKQWVSALRYDEDKGYNSRNSFFIISPDGVITNVPNIPAPQVIVDNQLFNELFSPEPPEAACTTTTTAL